MIDCTDVESGAKNTAPLLWSITPALELAIKCHLSRMQRARESADWRYAPWIVGVATLVGYLM